MRRSPAEGSPSFGMRSRAHRARVAGAVALIARKGDVRAVRTLAYATPGPSGPIAPDAVGTAPELGFCLAR
ncbi:hypothetical protein [Streptomyces sp. enrichment culture]|uniref:hypothetical protein n=1 Tax=Streptomyces sp. enrichment culture TaxID=1795815 RepID=UPI003F54D08C